MYRLLSSLILILSTLFCLPFNKYIQSLDAAIVYRGGKFMDANEISTETLEEHLNLARNAFLKGDWKEAAKQYRIVTLNFPLSRETQEAAFFLGVSDYNMAELDTANDAFSEYLGAQWHPQFFQDAVAYKLAIADRFANGEKRRFFGSKRLPKWASGNNMAIEIYDEIIGIVPCHEMAARALYAKGCLHFAEKDYRESVEAFQTLIRQFPRHELAPRSYLAINKIYLDQAQNEFQNPDILALADINARKFKMAFPLEEDLGTAEADVVAIKEHYARGLYNTGQFYERKKKPYAAILYYNNAIEQFPDTSIAEQCRQRLTAIQAICPTEK